MMNREHFLSIIDQIIYYGLFFFAFFSPLSISFTQIAGGIIALCFIIKILVGEDTYLNKSPLDKPILFFLAISILSMVYHLQMTIFKKEIGNLLLAGIYFIFIYNLSNIKDMRKIINLLFLVSFVASLYGIFQHATHIDFLRNKGWGGELYRAHGFFSLHITFGEYLAAVTSLIFGISIFSENRKQKIILFFMGIIMLGGVMASLSRGSWIGIFISIIFIGILRGWKHLAILLTCVIISFAIFSIIDYTVLERAKSIFDIEKNGSNLERITYWKTGLKIIKSYPILGIGTQDSKKIYFKYKNPEDIGPRFWHFHNNFLQIAVTRGLIVLVFFIWIIAKFFYSGIRAFRLTRNNEIKGILTGGMGAGVSFFVSGLTEYNWGDSEVMMLLWMIIAVTMRCTDVSNERK